MTHPRIRRRVVLVIEDDRPSPASCATSRASCASAASRRAARGGPRASPRATRPSAIVLDMRPARPLRAGRPRAAQARPVDAAHPGPRGLGRRPPRSGRSRWGRSATCSSPCKREQLVEAFQRARRPARRSTVQRVLVVEDDGRQRDAITDLLRGRGRRDRRRRRRRTRRSRQLRDTTFDCMVLDLSLPGRCRASSCSTGWRKTTRCSFPPVIVYTARALTADEEQRLRRRSRSIIVKGARSPERLLDEVTLFLHQVEAELPPEQQRMLRDARDREAVFEGRRILWSRTTCATSSRSRRARAEGRPVEIARNGQRRSPRLDDRARASTSC